MTWHIYNLLLHEHILYSAHAHYINLWTYTWNVKPWTVKCMFKLKNGMGRISVPVMPFLCWNGDSVQILCAFRMRSMPYKAFYAI